MMELLWVFHSSKKLVMTRDFETHPGIFTMKPEWLTIKHQDFSKYRPQILGMWVMDDSPIISKGAVVNFGVMNSNVGFRTCRIYKRLSLGCIT